MHREVHLLQRVLIHTTRVI